MSPCFSILPISARLGIAIAGAFCVSPTSTMVAVSSRRGAAARAPNECRRRRTGDPMLQEGLHLLPRDFFPRLVGSGTPGHYWANFARFMVSEWLTAW